MKRVQVLLVFLLLISCSPREILLPTTAPETSEPGRTPTPIRTSTPIPSPIRVPFTATPVPTSVTPVPTWLPDDQEAYLLKLIETNHECRLPCLFGIQPGVSTWEEIRSVEAPLHFRSTYLPDSNGFLYLYSHMKDKVQHLEIAFSGTGQIVERITADEYIFLPNDPRYSPSMARAAQAYFLPNILAQYGQPSRIRVHVQGPFEPNAGGLSEILIFYDQLGFGIHYFFINAVTQDPINGAVRTCLREDHLERIRLYLQAPGDRTPLEKMTTNAIGGNLFPYDRLKPLEDVTTVSIEDFTKRFTRSHRNECFDLS